MVVRSRADLSSGPTHPTRWWHRLPDGRVQCDVCPRGCRLREGQRGFCFVRARHDDGVVLTTYGRSSGFCIDPIEKKPLDHFLPGTPTLSFGTAGCNFGCAFCQNWAVLTSREWTRWPTRPRRRTSPPALWPTAVAAWPSPTTIRPSSSSTRWTWPRPVTTPGCAPSRSQPATWSRDRRQISSGPWTQPTWTSSRSMTTPIVASAWAGWRRCSTRSRLSLPSAGPGWRSPRCWFPGSTTRMRRPRPSP